MERTALIVGATGLIGGFLLKQLCDEPTYTKVICVTRKPIDKAQFGSNGAKLDNIVADFNRLAEFKEAMVADDVFCCLGTTIKVAGSQEAFRRVDYDYCIDTARLTRANGAQHYLLVSAIGANASSPVFYNRVKGQLEQDLREYKFPNLSIFRPSLLTGPRQEHRLGEAIGEKVMTVANLLLRGPFSNYHSIPGEQVARAMLATAVSSISGPARGRKVITYKQMAAS